MWTTPHELGKEGAGCPAPFSSGLDLAARCRSEELEVLDPQVDLVDAVTLDFADPRSVPSFGVDLATLKAVLADDLGGLLLGHHIPWNSGKPLTLVAMPMLSLAVLREPHLRVGGDPSEETDG